MVHVRVCKGPFDANVCDELYQIPGNDLANEADNCENKSYTQIKTTISH